MFNGSVRSPMAEGASVSAIAFYCCIFLTGSHISEVLQENEALKQRLDLLELQSEQDKEALRADAVQAVKELCRCVCRE